MEKKETVISFICNKYQNLLLSLATLIEEDKIEEEWVMLVKRAIAYSKEN